MARVEYTEKGWVKIDGTLTNLASFKTIGKRYMGHGEDPDEHHTCAIVFTPITPSEEDVKNGVDGSTLMTYLEVEERDTDYAIIEQALKG